MSQSKSKTIVIVGYGPGISSAVARKFGAEGFSVALVARSADRLADGVVALTAEGVKAAAFTADAGDPAAITDAIAKAHDALGPVAVLHWNAYGSPAGDLLEADPRVIGGAFDVAIVGLLAAVQAALPDLKAQGGSVLVTNGAFADLTPQIDAFANSLKTGALALANAAKHKLVGLLADRLKADGVHVGEVMVAGAVRGTGFAAGGDGIDPAQIAERFWALHTKRDAVRDRIGLM